MWQKSRWSMKADYKLHSKSIWQLFHNPRYDNTRAVIVFFCVTYTKFKTIQWAPCWIKSALEISITVFGVLCTSRSGTRNPLAVTLVLQPTSCNRPSLLKPGKYTSLYSNRYRDSLPFTNYQMPFPKSLQTLCEWSQCKNKTLQTASHHCRWCFSPSLKFMLAICFQWVGTGATEGGMSGMLKTLLEHSTGNSCHEQITGRASVLSQLLSAASQLDCQNGQFQTHSQCRLAVVNTWTD